MRPGCSAHGVGGWSALLFAIALIGSTAVQAAAPAASARERHMAQCVAALGLQAESLAAQAKAGDEAVLPLLQSRLEFAAAFVGDNYLHGDGDDDHARALRDEARGEQKNLGAAQLAGRQNLCAEEGAQLLAGANALQRVVVKRLAQRRLERMLRG